MTWIGLRAEFIPNYIINVEQNFFKFHSFFDWITSSIIPIVHFYFKKTIQITKNPIFESVYITIRHVLDILGTIKQLLSSSAWLAQLVERLTLECMSLCESWVRTLSGANLCQKKLDFFFNNWGLKWLSPACFVNHSNDKELARRIKKMKENLHSLWMKIYIHWFSNKFQWE